MLVCDRCEGSAEIRKIAIDVKTVGIDVFAKLECGDLCKNCLLRLIEDIKQFVKPIPKVA